MQKINEDDFLKPLFKKIMIRKVPGNITGRVMDQITADPLTEPAKRYNVNWWWVSLGLVSLVSMYLAGLFGYFYEIFSPVFNQLAIRLSEYISALPDIFPSKVVSLPSSFVIPAIITGILFFLIADSMFGQQLRSAGE